MHKIRSILQRAVLYLMIVILAGGTPAAVFAVATPPKPSGGYTYDAKTGHWSNNTWQWDVSLNKYVPVKKVVPIPGPSPAISPSSDSDVKTAVLPAGSVNPSSTNVTENANAKGTTNDNTGVNIANGLNSDAKSGSADVKKNTAAGDATTGNASAATTIVNSVHSTVDGNTGIAYFTTNLTGDVNGDITIGPSISNATVDKNTNIFSNTNINNSDVLTNNQNLKTTSGNATVSGNTSAGNATSGNSNTVANVLNLINTIVAANKSFVGTINIYGNLNGDILVSPDFIPQLMASNAKSIGNFTMPLSSTTNYDQSIVNNVKLSATSGEATVKNNTSAGNATTGTTATNLTILNLTGHKIDASKSLLVFVNVLGKWVGMIVDAPGATSAALGSGIISNNTTLSDNTNIHNNAAIINNLDLSSQTGNATVAANTRGGNSTTGDATASANIANISTSQFNLSDWFGVLYINVFGSWIGSFGVDTAAGTVTPLSGDAIPVGRAATVGMPSLQLGFTPRSSAFQNITSGVTGQDSGHGPVVATAGGGSSGLLTPASSASLYANILSLPMAIIGLTIVGAYIASWALRRWLALRAATV